MVKGALQPATFAGMAELADATDLKSVSTKLECRFDPGYRQKKMQLTVVSCVFLSESFFTVCFDRIYRLFTSSTFIDHISHNS